MGKKAIQLCALGVVAGLLALPSLAAGQEAEVYQHPIYAEGEECCCVNEGGTIVPVLRYQDTTYIPIRTAGEWMGKQVAWQQDTATVVLQGEAERLYRSYTLALEGTPVLKVDEGAITVQEAPQVKLQIDGETIQLYNQQGEKATPVMFHDMVYLPLLNIGEITGMEVTWVRPPDQYGREYIFLRTPISESAYQEANAYIAQQCGWIKAWKENLVDISRHAADLPLCVEEMEQGETLLQKMIQAQQPAAPCTKPMYELHRQRLEEVLELLQGLKARVQSGEETHSETIKDDVFAMLEYQSSVFGSLAEMSKVLEQSGGVNLAVLQNGY